MLVRGAQIDPFDEQQTHDYKSVEMQPHVIYIYIAA